MGRAEKCLKEHRKTLMSEKLKLPNEKDDTALNKDEILERIAYHEKELKRYKSLLEGV